MATATVAGDPRFGPDADVDRDDDVDQDDVRAALASFGRTY
jgi:hypothetical protein